MSWGKVTITYEPTGYHQNYKRNGVRTHLECSALVEDAVADSVRRIGVEGADVTRQNIAQNLDRDPGEDYRII